MAIFIKACAGVLMAVVLIINLGSHSKELGLLLGLAVCCMVGLLAMEFLQPVVDFLETLESLGNLDHTMIHTLLKAAGIGLLAEFAGLICNDAGNSSLGKAVQMMGTTAVLWLSIPLFTALLELLQKMLGEL